MIEKPLVSVVMATYNRADVISKTVKSIFEQNYRPLELIIVNDGSSDNTLAVLKHLKETFDFKLIDNPKNFGLQKSLNIGVTESKGKYIARIDDHDLWIQNDKLSKQVAFLEKHSEIGLVGTGFRINGKDLINPLTDSEIRQQILMRCPFCHVTILMRRSVFNQVGNYDETLPYSEDWDLWLKIGAVSEIANLPDITTQVIEAENDSLSADYFLKQLPLNRQLVRKYSEYFPGAWKAISAYFSLFSNSEVNCIE